jgi:hypothetical protein
MEVQRMKKLLLVSLAILFLFSVGQTAFASMEGPPVISEMEMIAAPTVVNTVDAASIDNAISVSLSQDATPLMNESVLFGVSTNPFNYTIFGDDPRYSLRL